MTPELITKMEHLAMLEHASMVGRILRVQWVTGYVGERAADFTGVKPMRVRVLPMRRENLLHWNWDFLDPYWDVELVGKHPGVPSEARNFWIHGPSYHQGVREPTYFVVEPLPWWQIIKLWVYAKFCQAFLPRMKPERYLSIEAPSAEAVVDFLDVNTSVTMTLDRKTNKLRIAARVQDGEDAFAWTNHEMEVPTKTQ